MKEQYKEFVKEKVRETFEQLSQDEDWGSNNKTMKLMLIGVKVKLTPARVEEYLKLNGIEV